MTNVTSLHTYSFTCKHRLLFYQTLRWHKTVGFVAILLVLFTFRLDAQVIFEDYFDDGVVDASVYTPIGNAILTESGGQMTIKAPAAGDGVSILMPPGGRCIFIDEIIPEIELDIGDEWAIRGYFSDGANPDIEAIRVSFLRPHWNRCQVKVTIAGSSQVVGFWGCSEKSLKRSCPKTAENIRIDWVKGEDGEDRIQVEIKQKDGTYKTVADRKSELSHDLNDWTKMDVVMLKEGQKNWTCPDPDGIGGGIDPNQGDPPGLVMSLNELVITEDHPNPPAAPVQLSTNVVSPGDVINDMHVTITDFPLFLEPDVTFSLGPGFLIENFKVIDGFNATADVFVSSRARKDGTFAKVETDKIILEGVIDVKRDANPVENTQPNMVFDCPIGLVAGQSFTVPIFVEDEDADYVIIEAVVEINDVTEQIIVESPYTAFETPAEVKFEFPGLPAGEYIILALADDGLVEDGGSLCACAFEVAPGITSVQSILSEDKIAIRPNPVSEYLSVELDLLQSAQLDISLISIYGESFMLNSGMLQEGQNQFNWPKPAGILPGLYFLQFATEHGVITKKVLFM